MPTGENLLVMEHCASCEREPALTRKLCIYCGRPLVLANKAERELDAEPESAPEVDLALFAAPDPSSAVNPGAIRVDPEEPKKSPQRKYDGPFWVGVCMGALGLVLIIYAAVQIYSSRS